MMWPNQMTYRVRGFKIYFPFPFHYASTEIPDISTMTNSYWLNFCRLSHVVGIIDTYSMKQSDLQGVPKKGIDKKLLF